MVPVLRPPGGSETATVSPATKPLEPTAPAVTATAVVPS